MKRSALQLLAAGSLFMGAMTSHVLGQLDSIHWIPPLHSSSNMQISDHYVYLSTPDTVPFTVTIRDGSGTVLATPIISNNSPQKYLVGTGQLAGSPLFVAKADLNIPLTGRGLVISAPRPFYANVRARSQNQADWATAKGRAALGTTFRAGGFAHYQTVSLTNRNWVTGIMATENNTSITISCYDPNLVLDGLSPTIPGPTINIILNQGECYVLSGEMDYASNLTGFLGALIQSDKPIVINNGNMNGTIHPTNTGNQDIGIDLSIPVEKLGQEYILVEGQGIATMERPIVVAHYDSTHIYVNGGSTPIATINGCEHYVIPNSYYQGAGHRNMYVRTSEPAYVYQALAATPANNAGGLVLVPPFSCFLPKEIDLISAIDSIGNTGYSSGALITTEAGSIVKVNGVTQPGAEPVTGAPWETYKVMNLAGDVEITSTGGLAVSVFGSAAPAGYAGYFSGFSNIPDPSNLSFSGTCSGYSTDFTASYDPNHSPDSITWNFDDPASGSSNTGIGTAVSHLFSAPGTYNVQMIVHLCQPDTVNATVQILQTPTGSAAPTICGGSTYQLPSGFSVSSPGNYVDTLVGAASSGCDSVITTNLTVIPLALDSTTYVECPGFSVTVGSNTYSATGVYYDTLAGAALFGCDSVLVTNLTIHTTALAGDNSTVDLCEDDLPIDLLDELGPVAGSNGTWDPALSSGGHVFDPALDLPGTYTYVVTNSPCPADTAELNIVVSQSPTVDLGHDTTLCFGEEITLTVTGGGSVLWSDGSTGTDLTVYESDLYSVEVSAGACTVYDDIQVDFSDCIMVLEMPNIFTPNGDGSNDQFIPITMENVYSPWLIIYNRWGQVMFEGSDLVSGWDGNHKGRICSDGTYFWTLKYADGSGNEYQDKGTVMLTATR